MKSSPIPSNKWFPLYPLVNKGASFGSKAITLILGFVISSMAIMVYVMVFGFRVMWMTMRSLRPQYTN